MAWTVARVDTPIAKTRAAAQRSGPEPSQSEAEHPSRVCCEGDFFASPRQAMSIYPGDGLAYLLVVVDKAGAMGTRLDMLSSS